MTATSISKPAISKKKRDSKKLKKAWRKVDITDVEDFLENKRLDERLGLNKKKNEELFVVDTETQIPGKYRTKAEQKAWAKQPCNYLKILTPSSAVEDPIVKRNRVRTPEERRDPLRKVLEEARRLQGKIPRREIDSIKGRKQHLNKLRAQKRKETYSFKKDLWTDDKPSATEDMWLNEETTKQTKIALGEFKVRPPVTLTKPRSQLPAVEAPHPGLSYNPSLKDHKALLEKVVERELDMARKEEHLRRVTAVPKITIKEKESNWMNEMMEGMVKNEVETKEESDDCDNEVKSVNLPTTRDRMKTRRQRRRRRELNQEASERKQAKLEKKKLNDVYRLRLIKEELAKKEAEEVTEREKKKKKEEEDKKVGVRRLAGRKYDEPLEQYTMGSELTGDLRRAPSRSSLLKERFFSYQKRNILAPAVRVNKQRKRKVKVFVKTTHRMEEEAKPKKKQKKNKLFVINKTY